MVGSCAVYQETLLRRDFKHLFSVVFFFNDCLSIICISVFVISPSDMIIELVPEKV